MALFIVRKRIRLSLFVYADESGVFDRIHNDVFVFGGVILETKDQRDNARRRFIAAERSIRARDKATVHGELKASVLPPKDKASLFRSINRLERFAVVIDQRRVIKSIFDDKKSKQRYLDYAFKIGLKKALQGMIADESLSPDYAESIYVYMDEHTTATNGRYEMQEALDAEFRVGTHNFQYQKFHPPILPNLKSVEFCMKDSQSDPLIRAADIVANKVYFHAISRKIPDVAQRVRIHRLP